MCTADKRVESLLCSPSGTVPCCQSDVCVSNCHSRGPSLTLGGCFPGLWVSVCLRVGMSVCLAECLQPNLSLTLSI